MKPSLFISLLFLSTTAFAEEPHIVLVMADDQGWGQTGYMDHPHLETPNLNKMAENGLRFDRFYAGAPVCSPTRATVLTGRASERTGVLTHGYALRLQEKTLPAALKQAGYATGHFGKWHLNGLRGPGVPVLAEDPYAPGAFGFDTWLTVTNFFDRDPLLSREGEFEEFAGDSSEVIVEEALQFIEQKASDQPTFTVIWYGTPHDPFVASDEDKAAFLDKGLSDMQIEQYGEIVAMDRSIGTLRAGLRDLGIADDTIVWYCSDNGGLGKMGPETVGGLRGSKGNLYEGGIRVPGIIEWPAKITEARVTDAVGGTVDIFPTLAEITGLPEDAMLPVNDGISLLPVIHGADPKRSKPLSFRYAGGAALVGDEYKIIQIKGRTELYNLVIDPTEKNSARKTMPEEFKKWSTALDEMNASVKASIAGVDYPGEKLDPSDPEPITWTDDPRYAPHLEAFWERPEYSSWRERSEKRKAAQSRKK